VYHLQYETIAIVREKKERKRERESTWYKADENDEWGLGWNE
jgi:hypothetical protein